MSVMMNRARLARAVAIGVCLAALAPTAGSAAIYDVTWKDSFWPGYNGPSFTWQIDSANPETVFPGVFVQYSQYREGYGTPYTIQFTNTTNDPNINLHVSFANSSFNYYYVGPQLYSGSEASPVFTPGTYGFSRSSSGAFANASSGYGSLVISKVDAPGGAAPEVGVGLLSMLAAAAALALTRMRRPWLGLGFAAA
ncbi:hypothetical protein U1769_16835 [Sphingomonas sp. ZT3P38]|uniref:hypothetical protein n=1 Tax=Parasphingomonas zepuensis TaxID=3096161 RepID=UPI002FCBCFDB